MRHLIICCDGTWQATLGGSNVVRLRNALAGKTRTGIEQRSKYVPGVGTTIASWLPGGLAGVGLSANIKQAYEWLAHEYRPDDVVALFGFSRGAYTARSLAGMIGCCGLLDPTDVDDCDAAIERVYRRYRESKHAPHDRSWRDGLSFRYEHDSAAPFPIHFIGVWDTVGALGIPAHVDLLGLSHPSDHEFHDVRLDRRIPHARHAIALDEEGGPFAPTLWHEPSPEQDVKQVWFPGKHLDVGGGWFEKGLSDGALLWMMDEAELAVDIEFNSNVRDRYRPNPLAVQHPVLRGLERIVAPVTEVALQPWPRAAPRVQSGHCIPDIHRSAYERQAATSLPDGPYRPTRTLAAGESATIDVPAADGWAATGLWLEPGTYTFAASGNWRSFGTSVGPAGGTRPSTLGNLLGSAVGRVEGFVRRAVKNDSPNLFGGRRETDLPWMSLVAYAVNEERDGHGKIVHPHQRIAIGDGTTAEIDRPGYLYAFANDAWGWYLSNSGAVNLTVNAG